MNDHRSGVSSDACFLIDSCVSNLRRGVSLTNGSGSLKAVVKKGVGNILHNGSNES